MGEKCKFERIDPGTVFEIDNETFLKINNLYHVPNGCGVALNLSNMRLYVMPNEMEIISMDAKLKVERK